MKYLLIFIIILLILPSCEQSTSPEQCEGDFCVEDLDVTFVVERNGYDQIGTNLRVQYKFRFKREGIIEYQIQNSILTGYRKDPYHHDEIYRGGYETYSGGFGTGSSIDYSNLKFTMVTVGFVGKFFDCSEDWPFNKSCTFHWEKTLIVPVQNLLED